jgi:iron complex transport system ATP-binding protein
MFEASNISLQIRNRKILDDVSISIQPGAFTAVVGANGAGKSSLLKVLANEHTQFNGQVTINGKQSTYYSPKELSLVRAVLPQSSALQFAFSVQQVVMLGRHAHKTNANVNQQIVDEIMEITGVEHLRDRNVMTLSGGEKQRVHLARVLAQVWGETVYPRYVLLDEPTSSLDIAQQQNIFALAKQVCQRNIGVMAIVHDLNQAVQFADQLYFMKEGKVVASGEAQKVFTKMNIEETFCCRVNVYHDPCNKCPFIIPERETPLTFPQKLKVNQS